MCLGLILRVREDAVNHMIGVADWQAKGLNRYPSESWRRGRVELSLERELTVLLAA